MLLANRKQQGRMLSFQPAEPGNGRRTMIQIENCHWGETVPTADWCPFHTWRVSRDVRAAYGSVIDNLQDVFKYEGLSRPGCWAYLQDGIKLRFVTQNDHPGNVSEVVSSFLVVCRSSQEGLICVMSFQACMPTRLIKPEDRRCRGSGGRMFVRSYFLYFFPKDSYLGVLRLFLRVLEVARSRRLGIAGEVSVWQIPENSVKSGPCHRANYGWAKNFVARISWQEFRANNLDGRYPYWKNDQ